MGRNKETASAGFSGPGLHDRGDCHARRRQTDRRAGGIFYSARFQRERRNLFRAVRREKRSDFEIELARSRFSRRVLTGREIGAAGRIRGEVENFLLRTGLPATMGGKNG